MFSSRPWHSWRADGSWLRPVWSASLAVYQRQRGRLPTLPPWVGWFLYTVICFIFFVFLTFPTDVLLQRVVTSLTRNVTVQIRYAEGDLSWWGGVILRDVAIADSASGSVPLQLSRLTLQPSLLGFIRNQPFPLVLNADVYGGSLTSTVQREGRGLGVEFALRGLTLERWPLPAPWDQLQTAGVVTADGALHGNVTDLSAVTGTFTLTLTDGALRAGTLNGFRVPALQPVQASLQADLTGERLEITELLLSTDGADAHLQGTVTLRTPVARSVLNLQLTAKSNGSPSPAVATLLALLPASSAPAGERRASIGGLLAAPVVR